VLQLGVAALIIEYLVLPQIAGIHDDLHLLTTANSYWLIPAFFLEVGSLLSFTMATRALIPHGRRPNLWRLFRIDLSTVAVSHVVPAGAAAGTGLGYRLLYGAGLDPADAAFAKGVSGVGAVVVLQLLLWTALAIAIPLHGGSPLYITSTIVGMILLGLLAGVFLLLTRAEPRAARLFRRVGGHLPKISPDRAEEMAHQLAELVRTATGDRRLLLETTGWILGNWLFDAGSLWCCLHAFGHTFGYDGLLVPYCLANVLAWIPVTPAGLGIVEGVLVPTLVGFGSPRGIVILGVLSWRLFNFWLPIPVGALAYLSLPESRLGRAVRDRRARRADAETGDDADTGDDAGDDTDPGGGDDDRPGERAGGAGDAGAAGG
jgi:uncharacterized protein (TIRG00374 family)